MAGKKVLWRAPGRGRDVLPTELRAARAQLDELVVYQNVDVTALPAAVLTDIEQGKLHWIGLSSPSIARDLAEKLTPRRKPGWGTT